MRLFFALWPPREAAEALHTWALLAQRATGGRVTRAETIHLTLAFLGEVEAGLACVLQGIPIEGKRHSLPIEEARFWAHNRIVWAGPRETPEALGSLSSSLSLQLKEKGFRTESRKFAAHITLIRKAREAGALPPLPVVDWPVGEIVLVRSQLSAAGSRYEVIGRFALS